MLDSIITASEITVSSFLICTAVSLVLGLGCALLCMYKQRYSQSYALTHGGINRRARFFALPRKYAKRLRI